MPAGGADALQKVGRVGFAAGARDAHAQKGRLVVSALEQPAPMQWDWGNEIAVLDQLGARALHPAREGGGGIDSIRMLESQDQVAAAFLVAKRRSGPSEGRSGSRAGAAKAHRADLMSQRMATAGTDRALEKGKPAPAFGTERTRISDIFAAIETARRQQRI